MIAKGLIEFKHNVSVKYRISFTSIGTFFYISVLIFTFAIHL